MSKTLTHIPADWVQEFDIGFSSGDSFVGMVIQEKNAEVQWITGSLWNHVYIAVTDEQGILSWYEAIKKGVTISRLPKYCTEAGVKEAGYKSVAVKRYKIDLSSFQKRAMRARAWAMVGKKYDFLGLIIGFPLKIWLKLKGLPFKTQDRWVCSSTVADIFRAGGVKLTPEKVKATSPEDIWQSEILI